jgi:hypothetical protein
MSTKKSYEAVEATVATMEPHEVEHYAAIQRQAQEVERLANEAIEAKEEASEAKKAYEGAVSTLRNLIRRGPDPQGKLFDPDADDEDIAERRQREQVGWRGLPIVAHLAIPTGTMKALERKGIKTLGELTDCMNSGGVGGHWFTKVPGVGSAAAEKVAEAYERFWAAHPEYTDAA